MIFTNSFKCIIFYRDNFLFSAWTLQKGWPVTILIIRFNSSLSYSLIAQLGKLLIKLRILCNTDMFTVIANFTVYYRCLKFTDIYCLAYILPLIKLTLNQTFSDFWTRFDLFYLFSIIKWLNWPLYLANNNKTYKTKYKHFKKI